MTIGVPGKFFIRLSAVGSGFQTLYYIPDLSKTDDLVTDLELADFENDLFKALSGAVAYAQCLENLNDNLPSAIAELFKITHPIKEFSNILVSIKVVEAGEVPTVLAVRSTIDLIVNKVEGKWTVRRPSVAV